MTDLNRAYERCFVGLVIPQPFANKFNVLGDLIAQHTPGFVPVTARVEGHITSNYLTPLREDDLFRVGCVVNSNKHLLRGKKVRIRGIQLLEPVRPKRIFLGVQFTGGWNDFCLAVDAQLGKYVNSGMGRFQSEKSAHAQVGKFEDPLGALTIKGRGMDEIARVIGDIDWEFTPRELVVYGMEAGDPLMKEHRLIEIPLSKNSRK
jgi:hypothetical protein